MKNYMNGLLIMASMIPAVIISKEVADGSVFWAMAIWCTYMLLIGGAVALFKKSVGTPKVKKELQIKFYRECIKNGITSFSAVKDKQKAELIAQQLGCKGCSNIEAYFQEGKALAGEKEEQLQAEKINAELDVLRKAEEESYAQLTKYAAFKGRNKRVAILSDMKAAYLKKASDLKKGMEYIVRDSQQKEIDWATHGGIASGIAGGAAGAAVAIDAQIKNTQIRAQNEANMRALAPGSLAVAKTAGEYKKKADELQADIDSAKIKLVADIPSEKVFENLAFSNTKVEISKTGAFTVETTVEKKSAIIIFESVSAVVDGTISADLYQDNVKVGSALLVLPTYGVCYKSKAAGICLNGASADKPYEVKLTPYHLWAMEK